MLGHKVKVSKALMDAARKAGLTSVAVRNAIETQLLAIHRGKKSASGMSRGDAKTASVEIARSLFRDLKKDRALTEAEIDLAAEAALQHALTVKKSEDYALTENRGDKARIGGQNVLKGAVKQARRV